MDKHILTLELPGLDLLLDDLVLRHPSQVENIAFCLQEVGICELVLRLLATHV